MRLLFVGVTFLGASLLFWSQPLLSKQTLPLLGGSPAVWNTCVFFFQVLLLAGYAWAHVLSRFKSIRLQGALQVALAALGLVFTLHITLTPGGSPVLWLLASLLGAVGLPFFILSSGAPLLQRWFSRISKEDPYQLYAASNVGSFLALLAFPLALEPMFPVHTQRWIWRAAYLLFVVLLGVVAWTFIRRAAPDTRPEVVLTSESITWKRRARWLLLSAAPSSLSLGTTTYLTTDIAPVPLLWVVPLAIYLLTFVLAFGAGSGGAIPRLWPIFGVLAILQIFTLIVNKPFAVIPTMVLHLLVLFLAARLCHGELAADRPSPARLTEFYLWLSAGGALGGFFNGVVAPLAFDSVAEFPIALLACMALAPLGGTSRALKGAAGAGLGLLAVWIVARYALEPSELRRWLTVALVYVAPPAALIWARGRNLRLVTIVIGPVLLATATIGFTPRMFQERSYFALHRVVTAKQDGKDYHLLYHGRIMHGLQQRSDSRDERLRPMSYYHQAGPLGSVFNELYQRKDAASVGVVGLGAGGLVAYGRETDRFVFYEIDPLVLELAGNDALFTYLSDARAEVEVLLGDGRLLLKEEPRKFDLLLLDAFGSDGVPMHLLTIEALTEVYLPRLTENGAVLFNVSNRLLDVRRIVMGLATETGLKCWRASGPRGEITYEMSPSSWVMLAGTGQHPGGMWEPCVPTDVYWTDDWSNLIQVFVGD